MLSKERAVFMVETLEKEINSLRQKASYTKDSKELTKMKARIEELQNELERYRRELSRISSDLPEHHSLSRLGENMNEESDFSEEENRRVIENYEAARRAFIANSSWNGFVSKLKVKRQIKNDSRRK